MSLFDKILDVYYDVTFRVQDLVDTVKYKTSNLVNAVKGHKEDLDIKLEEIVFKPAKKRKKTSKIKKK